MLNYVHGICCIFTTAFKLLNNYRLRELTPWNIALLGKIAVLMLVKIFPTLDGNQRFTMVFTSPTITLLIQMNPAHALPNECFKIHINIILLSMPKAFKWPLSSDFPTETWYAPHLSSVSATCPTHLILLEMITQIFGRQYKSFSSSTCTFLQHPINSRLLCPNILHSTILLNTFSLCSSIKVRDQVLHSYKATGQITDLFQCLYFRQQTGRQENLKQMVAGTS